MLTLAELETVLEQRKTADPEHSYVAQLHVKGLNKILEKLGEESTEAILAAKDYSISDNSDARHAFVGEVADLWFHTLVLLSHLNCSEHDIMQELSSRLALLVLTKKPLEKLTKALHTANFKLAKTITR